MLCSLKAEASMQLAEYEKNLYYTILVATEPHLVKSKITNALSRKKNKVILYREKEHPAVNYKRVLTKMIIEPQILSIMKRLKCNFPNFKFHFFIREYKQGFYMELEVVFENSCVIF
jgi:hypothetical protein